MAIVSLFMVLCTFFVFKFVRNMNLEIIFYKNRVILDENSTKLIFFFIIFAPKLNFPDLVQTGLKDKIFNY